MCAALTGAGDAEAGIAAGHEALRIAQERGDIEEIARAYVNLGETLDWAGRLEEAAEAARVGTAKVLEQGIGSIAALLASDHGARLLRLGRWDEADAVLSAGLDAAPAAGISVGAALCVRSTLDLLRGQFQEAAERVEEAERAQEHAIGSMWTGPIAAARAEMALWRGAPAEARDVIARLLDGLEPGDQDPFYLAPVLSVGARAAADLAVAARATGDGAAERDAVALATRLVERARHVVRPEAFPRGQCPAEAQINAASAAAELARARGEGEVDAWGDVAGRWHAYAAAYSAAYAQWRYAEAILAGGGARADAQAALTEAHAVATRLRARPLAGELEALARRARLTLHDEHAAATPAVTGEGAAERVGLTARELEVLRLVAAGQTNRGIGQALYISEKTVSVHISRILAKLDAGGRVEAAGLAHRLGLLEEAEA
jgi:DNA-binding CsgD family transcriptional regulator